MYVLAIQCGRPLRISSCDRIQVVNASVLRLKTNSLEGDTATTSCRIKYRQVIERATVHRVLG